MWRRLLAAAGLAATVGGASPAQSPIQQQLPGYVILRVNMNAQDGDAQLQGVGPGGPGGGVQPLGPGGPGGPGPGGPGVPAPGGRGGRGPGGGGPGFPGGPGFFGGQGNGGPAVPFDPTRSVTVVVPYKAIQDRMLYPKLQRHQTLNPLMKELFSASGNAFLYADKKFIQLYPLQPGFYLPSQLRRKHDRWKNTHDLQQGYDMVAEALSYGMVDDAFQIAEETARAVAGRKDSPPDAVGKFVTAFNQLNQSLKDPLPEGGEAARWQTTLGAAGVYQGAHYALIHWGDTSAGGGADTLDRRMKLLESNFKAFYLWHALAGVALKVPDHKLVVVMADRSTDMNRLHEGLDGGPMVSDAFYTADHNLVVMSPERLDTAGQSFTKFAQARYQAGWNRDDLLKGIAPRLKGTETAADVAQVMTIALVDRLVDEEAAVGMVTREASRQLYAASGLLAQHVILPEWVENGSSNLLHKPKGPAYTIGRGTGGSQGRAVMTVGLVAGYGSPNFVLFRKFRDLVAAKELNPNAEELLTFTLTDRYFEAAREGKDIDPPPGKATDDPLLIGGPAGGGQPGFGPPGGGFPGGAPGGEGPGGPGPGFPGGGRRLPGGGEGGEAGPGAFGPGGGGFGGETFDPEAEKRQLKAKMEAKAQVTSWALTFYLAKKKMPALIAFYGELSKMPRDMRLDPEMVKLTFCKSFGLMDTNNQTQVDAAAYKRFADDWVMFVKSYPTLGLVEVPIDQSSTDPGQGVVNPNGLGGGFGPGGGNPFGPGGVPGGGSRD